MQAEQISTEQVERMKAEMARKGFARKATVIALQFGKRQKNDERNALYAYNDGRFSIWVTATLDDPKCQKGTASIIVLHKGTNAFWQDAHGQASYDPGIWEVRFETLFRRAASRAKKAKRALVRAQKDNACPT